VKIVKQVIWTGSAGAILVVRGAFSNPQIFSEDDFFEARPMLRARLLYAQRCQRFFQRLLINLKPAALRLHVFEFVEAAK
jgi:tRNA-dihydrouridine synthase